MAETRRRLDQDFKEGAVRLVTETGKPIAQIAEDLGINAGTLANWVNADRRRREGNGSLSEDERAELVRLRRENAELAMERDVLKGSVALWGQGRDGAVSLAAFIAAQRSEHGIGHAVSCRGIGCQPGVVLQVAAGTTPGRGGPDGRPWMRWWLTCSAGTRASTGLRGSPPR